jgi:hypothetical protein
MARAPAPDLSIKAPCPRCLGIPDPRSHPLGHRRRRIEKCSLCCEGEQVDVGEEGGRLQGQREKNKKKSGHPGRNNTLQKVMSEFCSMGQNQSRRLAPHRSESFWGKPSLENGGWEGGVASSGCEERKAATCTGPAQREGGLPWRRGPEFWNVNAEVLTVENREVSARAWIRVMQITAAKKTALKKKTCVL